MINIALCSDENYIKYCCTVIASIIANTNTPEKLNFHILTPSLSNETRDIIKNWSTEKKIEISIYTVNTDDFSNIDTGRFSISTLIRLKLEDYIPKNITKIIYLDSDLVVLGDICNLFKTDLENQPVAATLDLATDPSYNSSLLSGHEKYFNAGVLLIDLEKWRNLNVFSKALTLLKHKNLKYLDQDALNLILDNNWKRLNLRYNFQPSSYSVLKNKYAHLTKLENEILESIKCPAIVHFIGKIKPWHGKCYHPLQNEFIKYSQNTPWPMSLKDIRENLSTKEKIKLYLKLIKSKRRRKMTLNID